VAVKKETPPEQTLDGVLGAINKTYGPGATMLLSGKPMEMPIIPSGSIGLDAALGIGGLPRGRIVEVYGQPSAGKTTAVLHAVANAQRAGGVAAFIDAENALTPSLVSACGGSPGSLILSQPSCGEEGLEIAYMLTASGQLDIVVVDSVAALVPRAEIEGSLEDSKGMALQARMMAQGLRKINSALAGNDRTCVVFINQLRERPGVLFGSPEYTPGGKALPFYAAVRLDVRAVERLKTATDVPYGNKLKVKVVKNKCAPPFHEATFDVWFGRGINHQGELIELGAAYGLVLKTGAFYNYNGQSLGQGVRNACSYLWEHPDIQQQIESALHVAMATGKPVISATVEPAAALVTEPPAFAVPSA
jgi:recombination protein RecA